MKYAIQTHDSLIIWIIKGELLLYFFLIFEKKNYEKHNKNKFGDYLHSKSKSGDLQITVYYYYLDIQYPFQICFFFTFKWFFALIFGFF